MPYLLNVNSYLHQSSLLLEAYPTTTRITTKYSLPRNRKSKPSAKGATVQRGTTSDAAESRKPGREHQLPAATLTFKTFETTGGICLKYQTNKSAEVGRLMIGLGRLANGGFVEESTASAVVSEAKEPNAEQLVNIEVPAPKNGRVSETAGGGGKAKKKKHKN